MKKIVKNTTVVALSGVMAIGMLSGCGSKSIDGEKTVATVDGTDIPMGVVSLYARESQAQTVAMYKSFMGSAGNIWSQVVDEDAGTTYGEQAVGQFLEQVELMYIMKEKAADYGVEVTSDDETAIADAAAQFMQDNDEDTLKELAVSEDQVKTLLELETYRQRIYDPIRNEAEVNITDEEAQEFAKLAEFGELDIKFAKTEQGTAVFYSTDIAEKIKTAREEYAKSLSESEQYRIDVTDNTISMDIKNLLVPELSDENTYFLRVPNTSGKDYIRLDKSDCEIINGGKSIKTELDMERKYSIYDSVGNIKQSRSGEALSKSYNTRHPHATKGTKVYEHGQGRERVNLFNKEKNEIISVKLDNADVMRTALKEHGITGKTADMLMEDINNKLSAPQKEIFRLKKGPPQPCTAAVPIFIHP